MPVDSGRITELGIEAGRGHKRVVVCLDGERWAALDPETILFERIERGQTLDRKRQEAILARDEAVRARQAAARHAAARLRTRNESEQYLKKRGFSRRAIESALKELIDSGTIDDERAADALVRRLRRRRDVGPRRLDAELLARGVTPERAEAHAARALKGTDVADECVALARRAAARYRPLDDAGRRRKLAAFLLRRGYPKETVEAALERIVREQGIVADENEEDFGP